MDTRIENILPFDFSRLLHKMLGEGGDDFSNLQVVFGEGIKLYG